MDRRLKRKGIRWRQLKRRRDWPPETETVLLTIERDGVRQVVAGYWVDEFDNWSFLEFYPFHIPVAWIRMPDPLPFTVAESYKKIYG